MVNRIGAIDMVGDAAVLPAATADAGGFPLFPRRNKAGSPPTRQSPADQ
jgi:hypothetical protein